ncbi:MAG: hypothetical protein K2X55_27795 [Burkholderiaceae bacterium]|nr:hypothetical protein [Burkholderiaceae bacterium]
MTTSCYPKGDLRRMLAVLGAIDQLPHPTISAIADACGFGATGGRTVRLLIEQARAQADVEILKDGYYYRIGHWGPLLKRDGVLKAWRGRHNVSE